VGAGERVIAARGATLESSGVTLGVREFTVGARGGACQRRGKHRQDGYTT
jgi:hypothetical protein